MASVNLSNVTVLDNPSSFNNPFQFEITFECIQELADDLEWKVTYVGCAESEEHDQVLEEVLVGPVPMGVNKFVLQAPAPDPSRIPPADIVGVTVVLLTCSYKDKEFVRVGYYVNIAYPDPERNEAHAQAVQADPSTVQVDVTQLQRNILGDKPRVTRYPIEWDEPTENVPTNANANQSMGDVSMSKGAGDMDMADDMPMQAAALPVPPAN